MKRPPEHPVWGILHTAVILAGLTAILWVTAVNFDASELKVIGTMLPIVAGSGFGIQKLRQWSEGRHAAPPSEPGEES